MCGISLDILYKSQHFLSITEKNIFFTNLATSLIILLAVTLSRSGENFTPNNISFNHSTAFSYFSFSTYKNEKNYSSDTKHAQLDNRLIHQPYSNDKRYAGTIDSSV